MLSTAIKAAHRAGKILKEYFNKSYKIESKDVISNLVTEVDKKAEEVIFRTIKKDYPTHNLLSEEFGALDKDSDVKWIIDPLDGTINYAHSIPICCISIGVEIRGKIIYGVIYNPFGKELFTSEKGKGSYLNGKKITVSKVSNIGKALLVTGFPYMTSKYKQIPAKIFIEFVSRDIPIRRLGSASLDLCYTACGKFDGFWEYNLNPWDVAAGYLILKEAGGKITNFGNRRYSIYEKEILATNGLIHNQMQKIIESVIRKVF